MKRVLLSVFVLSMTSGAFAQGWVEQNTNLFEASRGVYKLNVVDASTVWGIAYDGSGGGANVQEFTKTTDGGATWIPGFVEVFDPELSINNISAIDGNTAFVSMINGDLGGGGVYKTIDGGENWDVSNPGGYTSAASFLNVVHFFDANVGVTSGDPINGTIGEYEVYRTTDGGDTWVQATDAALPNPVNGEYGYNGGNVAYGNSFWFVTNKGNIYRTTDTGLTWNKFDTPLTDFSATATGGDMYFSNENLGILVKRTGAYPTGAGVEPTYVLHRTFDGGATWDAGTPWTGNLDRPQLAYIPNSTTIVATSAFTANGRFGSEYSTDNGATWNTIDFAETQRGDVAFADGSTGWSGGFTSADISVGGIYKFDGTLALNNVAANTKFSATPNPTNGALELSNESAAISNVAVYNLLGKQVYNAKFSALNNVTIDLSSLATGAYILQATDAAGASQSIKIMKN